MSIGIPHLSNVQQEKRGLGRAVLSRSQLKFRVSRQSVLVVVQSGMEEDTERVVTSTGWHLSELWKKGPLGSRMQRSRGYGSTSADPQGIGESVSIVTDGRNGVEVYLALRLNGRGVYGLLDTWCDTSVISRRVIPNERLKLTTQKLYAANGTEMALLWCWPIIKWPLPWWSPRRWMIWFWASTGLAVTTAGGGSLRISSKSMERLWDWSIDLVGSMLRRIYAVQDTIVPAATQSTYQ